MILYAKMNRKKSIIFSFKVLFLNKLINLKNFQLQVKLVFLIKYQ